ALDSHRLAVEARKAAWAGLKEDVDKTIRGYRGAVGLVIKDLDTGWQIDANKDIAIPSASIVKIPIMMAVFSAAKDGKINLNDTIELKNSDKTDGSGVLKNALAGPGYKVEDLISLMITQSDNTAANMLIDRVGIDDLNSRFAKLGLKHTNLSRKMMDFRSRKSGVENYTTAGDMAYLLEGLYRGKFLGRDVSNRCLEFLAEQKINDRIPRRLPADTTVAHKTGLENGVCHDVGIVYTDKGNFLICVLVKHRSSTARVAKKLIAHLSLAAYSYYQGF
ncbi:MAG: class A beta-lactamase-related serine hydrolase, partial [Candidatus Omnitrophica bacterium]|nr:class A beta-lactamase-related serine hydrolase [Candidatus Omnitrophota bacterium]